MSVNIFDGTNLTPIAGKTVPAPTPDYVDEQYSSSKTYSKGMTCISGNVRYRYKNSTATSGHRPPDTTYWEVLSVSDQTNVCGKWTLLGTYKGTTSLNSYQVLPTQTLSNITVTDIINNYKAIAIVFLNYSSAQDGNDGYMPIASAIFPTDLVYYLPPRNNYAALYGWHISANAPCLIQVTFGSNNVVSVDTQVRTSTSTTYKVGFAIYGIK